MKNLPTFGLLAGLLLIPGLSAAESRTPAATAPVVQPDSPATIAYGPPVVYYGDDWERPRGTHQHQQQQLREFAQAKARSQQSQLAAAQWQASDVGKP